MGGGGTLHLDGPASATENAEFAFGASHSLKSTQGRWEYHAGPAIKAIFNLPVHPVHHHVALSVVDSGMPTFMCL
jgi:hypothetical protein